eukprot:scaffold1574_cov373-Prasinococcus_capsulatus_cf.AAC.1
MTEVPVSKPPIFTSASESVRPSDPVGNDALLPSKPALERTQTIGKTMAETPTSWASGTRMHVHLTCLWPVTEALRMMEYADLEPVAVTSCQQIFSCG